MNDADQRKMSAVWLKELYPNITILDPDGWDRSKFNFSFNRQRITRSEFESRLMASTIEGDVVNPLPPEGCICASFWTVQQAHKSECPLATPLAPLVGGELKEELAKLTVHITNEMMRIIGDPNIKPEQVHPQRLALCRSVTNGLEQLFDAHLQAAIDEARIESYDQGYEAGEKAKPAKLPDALEFRREQYGWSAKKMAAMLDMSNTHYSEFIHGKRALPINAIRKAYAIGIPASVLLADDIEQRLNQGDDHVQPL